MCVCIAPPSITPSKPWKTSHLTVLQSTANCLAPLPSQKARNPARIPHRPESAKSYHASWYPGKALASRTAKKLGAGVCIASHRGQETWRPHGIAWERGTSSFSVHAPSDVRLAMERQVLVWISRPRRARRHGIKRVRRDVSRRLVLESRKLPRVGLVQKSEGALTVGQSGGSFHRRK